MKKLTIILASPQERVLIKSTISLVFVQLGTLEKNAKRTLTTAFLLSVGTVC